MSTLRVDLDLVRKYSVPGPRYTSYPPATRFDDTVTVEALLGGIRANNATSGASRDLSLYFHLPFCQTLCWFCGCTTVITTQQGQSAKYIDYLRKELELMGRWLDPRRRVVQLHFGGGTPSFLLPDEIRTLGRILRERFAFASDIEAGVEIDPRRLSRDHLVALREAGFNRASIGVQDNHPEVQAAVHRIQPFDQSRQTVDWIRETGFQSVNIDLIYGLPHQTPTTFAHTLEEVLTLRPDRFAIFNYAHVPWIKPAQRIFKEDTMPSADTKLEILKLTIEMLTAAGYDYVGMDHFALADDELSVAQRNRSLQRNFQGYSTRGGADIYAFGMSAISQADGLYWQNEKELPDYYGAIDQGRLPIVRGYVMTDEDKRRRQVIMRLMCDFELEFAPMSAVLGVDFERHFARELDSLADMEADGLIARSAGGIQVTDLGRLLIRNIAMRFDEYLPAEKERRFSKTI